MGPRQWASGFLPAVFQGTPFNADKPIALPPQRANDGWTQPGGQANNAPGHLALASAVREAENAQEFLDRARTEAGVEVDAEEKQRLVDEFSYAAKSWPHERRVITRLEWGEQGHNPRFIVTNLAGDPQALYDGVYCQRGEAENRIKEAQVGLFATRTSCHVLRSNQLRMLLAALGYVLVERLRALALQGTELATAQIDTLRIKLDDTHDEMVFSLYVVDAADMTLTHPQRVQEHPHEQGERVGGQQGVGGVDRGRLARAQLAVDVEQRVVGRRAPQEVGEPGGHLEAAHRAGHAARDRGDGRASPAPCDPRTRKSSAVRVEEAS